MKIYCGPPLPNVPSDAPAYSLWQRVLHRDPFVWSPHEDTCFAARRIIDFDQTRVRRIYPVGCVVPEPRPLTEDLIRACWRSHTIHMMVATDKGGGDSWQYLACNQALELYNEWDKLWGYQVDTIEINGVLTVVAVPWFDQFVEVEG